MKKSQKFLKIIEISNYLKNFTKTSYFFKNFKILKFKTKLFNNIQEIQKNF